MQSRGITAAMRGSDDDDAHHHESGRSTEAVIAGASEAVSTTGGGSHSVTVMRFMRETAVVHVGDTVEWTNFGPVVQHTVTFGTEPADPAPPRAASLWILMARATRSSLHRTTTCIPAISRRNGRNVPASPSSFRRRYGSGQRSRNPGYTSTSARFTTNWVWWGRSLCFRSGATRVSAK